MAVGLRKTWPVRPLRTDLVAPDDPRRAVPRVEDDVEDGRGDADQRLDPAPPRELLGAAVRHGRAILEANARITGCARVPSPASSGWNSVPRKNVWSVSSSDVARRHRRGRQTPRPPVPAGRCSPARSRRRSGSARRCARPRRSRRCVCRACSGSALRARRASTPAPRSTSAVGESPYSAWCAPSIPARLRASSRIACWKPPQVPRNGMSCSRAVVTAAITRSASSYGLPGTTQMPSKPSRSVACVLGIQYGSRTRPSRRRSASISSGIRVWARTEGERSPTSASLAVGMPASFRPPSITSNDLLWAYDHVC